jgi:type III secretion protein R
MDPAFNLIGVSLIIAMVPVLVGALTSYLKVSLVFGMLKSGFATQHMPGALVTMVISLALTAFIMGPIFSQIELSEKEMQTLVEKKAYGALGKKLWQPWREFLSHHAGAHEIYALVMLRERDREPSEQRLAEARQDPTFAIPAFVLTELKEGIQMGFILLLPFLVIDLIVANILAGLGMSMVNPTLLSLPLKLAFFVAADGFLLISKGLVLSYG